jgi:hypothetical protein
VGPALYSVASWGTIVSAGEVLVGGARQRTTGEALGCGDGPALTPRPSASPSGGTSVSPSPSPSPSASPSPSPSPSPTAPTTTRTTRTTTRTTQPSPSPSPPPPGPQIFWITDPGAAGDVIYQQPQGIHRCFNEGDDYFATAVVGVNEGDLSTITSMTVRWSGFASGQDPMTSLGELAYVGTIGPVPAQAPNPGGTLQISVVATNEVGGTTTLKGTNVQVMPCSGPDGWVV